MSAPDNFAHASIEDFRYCWQEYRRCIVADRPRWREFVREAIADIRYMRNSAN